MLDGELARLPVAMERGSVQIEVLSQNADRFATGKKKPNGADVSVVGAPFDQRDTIPIR
jgi:hypothetical protein